MKGGSRLAKMRRKTRGCFPPCGPLPSFLPSAVLTVSTATRKTRARPNLFYCSLLLSFLFPLSLFLSLSLSLSVGVSQWLLFSLSLSLPPLSAAIGGLVFFFFSLKRQLRFPRQTHRHTHTHTHTRTNTHPGGAPCLTVIFLTNTYLFFNLGINNLMNHVTWRSGRGIRGEGAGGVGEGGGAGGVGGGGGVSVRLLLRGSGRAAWCRGSVWVSNNKKKGR